MVGGIFLFFDKLKPLPQKMQSFFNQLMHVTKKSPLATPFCLDYSPPMMELPKPDIIFTHESDLDGLVAGLMLQKLAKHLYYRDVPLEAYHYNYWKQRELRE